MGDDGVNKAKRFVRRECNPIKLVHVKSCFILSINLYLSRAVAIRFYDFTIPTLEL